MAKLNRSKILFSVLKSGFFLDEADTYENYTAKKVEDLHLDVPPLPRDPELWKKTLNSMIKNELRLAGYICDFRRILLLWDNDKTLDDVRMFIVSNSY